MAVAVPAYNNACLAPDRSGTAVWLVGVPIEGLLEVYSVNFANINTPTATLIVSQTNTQNWSYQAQRACFNYPGNTANTNSPIFMQQFGLKSYFSNIYPNGTMDFGLQFANIGFVSPKLFSWVGAAGDMNWFATITNVTSAANSPWLGLRFNGTVSIDSGSDFIISMYPTSNPLLSVGVYIPSSDTLAQGYQIVFDNAGGGIVYTAIDSAAPILTDQDHKLYLSTPQTINMTGIVLTTNAIPITMANMAYILDKAADGSSVLYRINPTQSPPTLQVVAVQGNVPPFSANIAATAMSSKIVIYGASSSEVTTATFNAFDTIASAWSGPGLVKSAAISPPGASPSSGSNSTPGASPSSGLNSPTNGGNNRLDGSTSKSSLGPIVGGVVGGLVAIALIAFLFIRQRRDRKKKDTTAVLAAALPPIQPITPQFQQQQYNPHHSYIPQSLSMDLNKEQGQQPQPSHLIFQAQQPYPDQPQTYSYVPPTLMAIPHQQTHKIFQPQVVAVAASNSGFTQVIYTPSTGGSTPQTPNAAINQAHTPSSGTPSSPQYIPSDSQGHIQ